MEQISTILESLFEPITILVILVLLLLLNSWTFKKIKSVKSFGNVIRNTISIFVILIGVLIFILSFPIDKALKGQILSFLAIIISAGIALSSTTVLGNLIAGIMNNSINRFRNGDLIKIGEIQGRVTKKGVFHTEIQLEDSNFITIPNLYIATNPIKLTRKTNTIISSSVSLGYDGSRTKIEELLKKAAIQTGLTEPYVYITKLGDYSVEYKVHGFLKDSNKYFSTISNLNGNVMDVLHENKIEIVSPSFMNQRRADERTFIPNYADKGTISNDELIPEDLIFDEAIKSEKIEKEKDYLKELDEKQEKLNEKLKDLKDEDEVKKVKSSIKRIDKLKANIKKSIDENNKK